jgi:hypothetical protein
MSMLFSPGRFTATPGAVKALEESPATPASVYLRRHLTGDWGEMDEYDTAVNNRAVEDGDRILSAYTLPSGKKIWIITEADRSVTTILLPDEY